jgi:hypothetical protein
LQPHSEPATLIGLELGVLEPSEREKAIGHLAACEICSERRREIRAELESIAGEMRRAIQESAHIPTALLAEFSEAPSELGVDVATAIQRHLDFCDRCTEEVTRAREGAQTAWLAAVRGQGEGAGSGVVQRRRPVSRISLVLAAAAVAVMIAYPRWFARQQSMLVAAGTPVRLLGTRAATESTPVALRPDEPLILFIKLAQPPDPQARYELVLRSSSGAEIRREVDGQTFDRTGTMGVLVGPGGVASGERVSVEIYRAGDVRGEPIFTDDFTILRSAGGRIDHQ